VDDFLSEIPADLYLEWQAFDAIEPINQGDSILMRLFGSGKSTPAVSGAPWQAQKASMMQYINLTKAKK
jgi:hypothetical protein